MVNINTSKSVKYLKIYNYAYSLVEDYAIKDYGLYHLPINKIPEIELNNLTAMYLDYYNRDLIEALDDDVTCAILSIFKDNNKNNKENLSEIIRNKVISQYEDEMQILIDHCCSDYLQNKNEKPEEDYFDMEIAI